MKLDINGKILEVPYKYLKSSSLIKFIKDDCGVCDILKIDYNYDELKKYFEEACPAYFDDVASSFSFRQLSTFLCVAEYMMDTKVINKVCNAIENYTSLIKENDSLWLVRSVPIGKDPEFRKFELDFIFKFTPPFDKREIVSYIIDNLPYLEDSKIINGLTEFLGCGKVIHEFLLLEKVRLYDGNGNSELKYFDWYEVTYHNANQRMAATSFMNDIEYTIAERPEIVKFEFSIVDISIDSITTESYYTATLHNDEFELEYIKNGDVVEYDATPILEEIKNDALRICTKLLNAYKTEENPTFGLVPYESGVPIKSLSCIKK